MKSENVGREFRPVYGGTIGAGGDKQDRRENDSCSSPSAELRARSRTASRTRAERKTGKIRMGRSASGERWDGVRSEQDPVAQRRAGTAARPRRGALRARRDYSGVIKEGPDRGCAETGAVERIYTKSRSCRLDFGIVKRDTVKNGPVLHTYMSVSLQRDSHKD